ncbi:MAG: adenylosuccinate lyase [Thermoplasmata archaeon]
MLCPLDFRYGRPEMRAVFSEDRRLRLLLEVEVSLAEAHMTLGNIPRDAARAIASAVEGGLVKAERVAELEAEIRHDVMALVLALSEASGDYGRFVHLGATSNDVTDTAAALQFKEAIPLIEKDLLRLQKALVNLALEHKATIMVGRTHGQAAVPLTFGMKMAVFALEVHRHLARLREMTPRMLVGKMSGAVGTGAGFGEAATELQDLVMATLGLTAEEASTQIVGRDRYAEYVALLAGIAASLERFATEIRNLQRTEIGEVAEAFGEKQVGSSTMGQKENPITSENISSLARIVRGFVGPAYENVVLWHERDLSNSAAERFILPHVTVLVDDILHKAAGVFETLRVRPERMEENLQATAGLVMAEAVMTSLTRKGMGRQEAHELTRRLSRTAKAEARPFREVLLEDGSVASLLGEKGVEKALDPRNYLGASEAIVDRVAALTKETA